MGKKIKNLNNLLLTANLKEVKNKNLIIIPFYIGKILHVHDGKTFKKLIVKKEMIGHKIGEFCKTRKSFKFKKK
jgi:ribosomal protein S19